MTSIAPRVRVAQRAVGVALLAATVIGLLAGCAGAATVATVGAPESASTSGTAEPTGSPASQETTGAAPPVEESEQERIWRLCWAPSGNVGDVNKNPAVIDEVLSDYPSEWSGAVPVPTTAVAAVCHQQTPSAGVKDAWWVHFTDLDAGYQAALAWKAQLDSAGASESCYAGMDLSNGPVGSYFCGYTLPNGYGASITNGHGAVDLRVGPPL